MKILLIHSDFIEFEAKKKAIKSAEEIEKGPVKVEECLTVFTAVEKSDEGNTEKVVEKYLEEVKKVAKTVNTQKIVIYPYAHLSNSLSSLDTALEVMKESEVKLKSEGFEVVRAPFGWYKSFNISCKGHPLSELSREIIVGDVDTKAVVKEEKYDPKKLLKKISNSRLDTSKLKDNDHRIIGQKMNLFSFNEVAPGMVFWHDKGFYIYNSLISFMRELMHERNYEEIKTPQVMDKKLWQISGHWDKYKENNFSTSYENKTFLVKPMNCPGGMLIYKNTTRSYKDLPLKSGEFGIVHRNELSGVLGGLFRVIQFTQDDAHVFCTEKQLEDEIFKLIELIDLVYSKFGFKYSIELSTRPETRIGDDSVWDKAEAALEAVLKKKNINYKVNEGDGAFYGPKIDYHIKDSLDRTWQCGTIQADFALPERFELEYVDSDNTKKRPTMVHRAIYGSLERFIGILLEHTNGKLPLWISPNQVKILTVNDSNNSFAQEIYDKLHSLGVRVELDTRAMTTGKKVREAQIQRFNYAVTVGDKETESKTLAVKVRDGDLTFGVSVDEFVSQVVEEIKNRA